jgi:RNA polymerase sigma-70 factor (ECF subfamily)
VLKPQTISRPGTPVWDEAKLAACRRGDRAALAEVLQAEAPNVERTLARIVGSRADVEDLLQKTLVVAIRGFDRFRGEASVRTWLTSIAVRLAQEHVRRPQRTLALVVNPEDPRPDPERAMDARRRLARLHQVLEKIDPKKRVAFVLHAIEGRSMEEVAALTGATRAATKSRVFFARRKLVKLMRGDPLLAELVPRGEGE